MELPVPLEGEEYPSWQAQVAVVLGRKPTAIESVGGIYCLPCQDTFNTKKEYDTHYLEHSKDIQYTCVVCRQQFNDYPKFRNHCYLVHVTKNKFKCQYCLKSYSKLSVLNSHIDAVHVFKCPTCKQQFTSHIELQTHLLSHKTNSKEKPPYNCKTCNQSMDSITMCEVHVDKHCSIEYPCPICDHIAHSHADASNHLTTHFDEVYPQENLTKDEQIIDDCSVDILGGILCNHCDELFKNRLDFDSHHQVDHPDKELMYSCNICGKQLATYYLFGNHCYQHFAKDRFECTDCEKTFSRLCHLIIHTEAFHSSDTSKNKPFTCGDCSHAFGSGRRLQEHWRVAHSTELMRCPEQGCQEAFESLSALVLHGRSHRAAGAWCRACGLSLRALSVAVAHVGVHRRALYACPVCARAYREKYALLKHLPAHFEAVLHMCKVPTLSVAVAHVGVHRRALYACPVCARAYREKYALLKHLPAHFEAVLHMCKVPTLSVAVAHVGVHRRALYACPVCARAYREKYALLKHLPAHFEAVLHMCKVCGKGYSLRSRLVQHSKVHSQARENICAHCGKGFVKLYHLHQHLNIHSGARPYKCHICSKTFANKPNWHKHCRKVHNIDNNTLKAIQKSTATTPEIIQNTNPEVKTVNATEMDVSTNNAVGNSFETYDFRSSDDDTMDSLDPAIIEKDWNTINANYIMDTSNYGDYSKQLTLLDNGVLDSCVDIGGEYGPSPLSLHADDTLALPTIDPRLATKHYHVL